MLENFIFKIKYIQNTDDDVKRATGCSIKKMHQSKNFLGVEIVNEKNGKKVFEII